MQLSSLVLHTCRAAENVAGFIRGELGKVAPGAIGEKSLHSLVSYVDTTAEQQLVQSLGQLLPGAAFLTEEATVEQGDAEWRWIIDPLDGTTNFLHRLPIFSISIALQHLGKTVLGVVYEVNRDECFYAWEGGGAWLNGQSIRVSDNPVLKDSLMATGFPYYNFDQMRGYFRALERFMQETRGIRRLGSAAVDLAYVACGKFDAFFEYSLQPWDVAGGAIIVQEAGGVVTDFSGGDSYLLGKSIIASSKALYPAVLPIILDAFEGQERPSVR